MASIYAVIPLVAILAFTSCLQAQIVTCASLSGTAANSGKFARVDQPYLFGNFPFRAVFRIVTRRGTYRDMCSGVAVGPFEILTAAHCVWLPGAYLPDEIWVFPAQSDVVPPFADDEYLDTCSGPGGPGCHDQKNVDLPFGVAKVLNPTTPLLDPSANILVYPGWYEDNQYRWDIALLHVDRPIAGSTLLNLPGPGAIGVQDLSVGQFAPGEITAAGYPGDVPTNNQFQFCTATSGNRLGQSPPPGNDLAPQRLYFDVPTEKGESGGPVWFWDSDGRPYVFAVISGDITDSTEKYDPDPQWAKAYKTRATLVTDQLISDIKSRNQKDLDFSDFRPDLFEYGCPVGHSPLTQVPYKCPPGVGTLGKDYPPPPGKALLTNLTYPGGSIAFTYSVQNAGHDDSGEVDLYVYLSKDTNIDESRPDAATALFSLGQFTAAFDLEAGEFIYPQTIDNYAIPACDSKPNGCPNPGQYYLGWVMHSDVPQYDDTHTTDWSTTCDAPGSRCFPETGSKHSVVIPDKLTIANILVNPVLIGSNKPGPCSVDSDPCNGPTPKYLPSGQTVALSAPALYLDPDGGKWAFNSWTDGKSWTSKDLAPTIAATDSFVTYTVYFFPRYPLTLDVSPPGAGNIVALNPNPDGYYDPGTPVKVQATANPGYKFTAFSGGFIGSANPASVTVSSAKTVTANFVAVGSPALTLGCTLPVGFLQGGTGVYVVLAGNVSSAGTTGSVTVTETVPAGLSLLSMSGTGWNCSNNQCSRADALPAGAAYPPITVTVAIDGNAPPQVINHLTISGGGAAPAGKDTVTTIGTGSNTLCDINGDGFLSTADVVGILQEGLGITAPMHDLNADSSVNVADIQETINAGRSLGCPVAK